MLEISISGMEAVNANLQAIDRRAGNLRPLFFEIGEDMVEVTNKRFETATDPDGAQWIKNSDVTLANKSGSKPLTDHGNLAASIHYNPPSNDSVEFGSNAVQAAMMQFGGTKAEFPTLWGDIPARPFLGLSDADKQNILDLTLYYLL